MKKARLTIDMSISEHICLKTACAKLGFSMREFLLLSAFEKIENLEDSWLVDQAKETLLNIKSRKEKSIPWSEMKERLK